MEYFRRLYQLVKKPSPFHLLCLLGFLVSACGPINSSTNLIEIQIAADGGVQTVEVSEGSSAREAFELAGIELSSLDKSNPPLYAILQEGDTIDLTRVQEEFIVEQTIIPYETQILRNESLAEGEQRLIQPGQNGKEEITYRVLFENGEEVSRSVSASIVLDTPVAEIVMIGSQAPFTVLPIPGILAYISAGNAWIMRENTGVREPIVTTGDLDGRIFSISPNGRWLLYTRTGNGTDSINSLWVARIDSTEGVYYDLGVENLIHFADWIPGSSSGIVFSTAEVNPGPPGWQANNDLIFMNFSEESGWTSSPRESLESNSGGLYGWWGTDFEYSFNGDQLAYARPDGFGIIDLDSNRLVEKYQALSVQTRSDWAWIPPLAWAADSNYLYFVDHVPQEGVSVNEDSQVFDLSVFPMVGGAPVTIVPDVGMFAYPKSSPIRESTSGEKTFSVAFLKALAPRQSRTSSYQLMVMDRDGSNRRELYPLEGESGLEPQKVVWSPDILPESDGTAIAVVNQGNIWLLDPVGVIPPRQITGDGLVTRVDWK